LRHQPIEDFEGLFLHGGQDVGIRLERGRDIGVTKTLAHDLRMDALGERQRKDP
jgi:hypothetical protein